MAGNYAEIKVFLPTRKSLYFMPHDSVVFFSSHMITKFIFTLFSDSFVRALQTALYIETTREISTFYS